MRDLLGFLTLLVPFVVGCETGLRPPTAGAISESSAAMQPSPAPASGVANPNGPPARTGAATPPHVANAEAAIKALRPRFRGCYNTGLQQHPDMEGSVVVTLHIAPDGSVSDAAATEHDGLSPAVVECIRRVLQRAQFEPPGDQGSIVAVPVRFEINREAAAKASQAAPAASSAVDAPDASPPSTGRDP
jgi:hypothetical protein